MNAISLIVAGRRWLRLAGNQCLSVSAPENFIADFLYGFITVTLTIVFFKAELVETHMLICLHADILQACPGTMQRAPINHCDGSSGTCRFYERRYFATNTGNAGHFEFARMIQLYRCIVR
jgi:hypothetical protein